MDRNRSAFSIAIVLLAFLLGTPAVNLAQSSAQGAQEHLVLQKANSTKKKRIPKGARINVYGPPGTLPIKGRLHSSGDSLAVTKLDKKTVVKVSSDSVVAVQRVIWAVILLGAYYLLNVLVSLGMGLFGLGLGGLSVLAAVLVSVGLSIPSIVIVIALFWLGSRKYAKPKWEIVKPQAKQDGA